MPTPILNGLRELESAGASVGEVGESGSDGRGARLAGGGASPSAEALAIASSESAPWAARGTPTHTHSAMTQILTIEPPVRSGQPHPARVTAHRFKGLMDRVGVGDGPTEGSTKR